MKVFVVLAVDVPEPEDAVDVLNAIDPPSIPFFTGTAHLVVEPHATELQAWLDD